MIGDPTTMAKFHLKAPNGSLVFASQSQLKTEIKDGVAVESVNENLLKDGWSIATAADIAKAEEIARAHAAHDALAASNSPAAKLATAPKKGA